MRTQWIEHQGKQILFIDCSDMVLEPDLVKEELETAFRLASQEPLNSVLTLTNVHRSKMSPETLTIAKQAAKKMTPYAHKRAIVGLTDVQRVFLNALNALFPQKEIRSFEDIEEAKIWLTQ